VATDDGCRSIGPDQYNLTDATLAKFTADKRNLIWISGEQSILTSTGWVWPENGNISQGIPTWHSRWRDLNQQRTGALCGKLQSANAGKGFFPYEPNQIQVVPVVVTPEAATIGLWIAGAGDKDGSSLLEVARNNNKLVALPYVNSLPADWVGVLYFDGVGKDTELVTAVIMRSLQGSSDTVPGPPLSCTGTPCLKDTDCGGNAPLCNTAAVIGGDQTCEPKRGLGERCTYDGSCASGSCWAPMGVTGECQCQNDSQCSDGQICSKTKGIFTANACVSRILPTDSDCSHSRDCASGCCVYMVGSHNVCGENHWYNTCV